MINLYNETAMIAKKLGIPLGQIQSIKISAGLVEVSYIVVNPDETKILISATIPIKIEREQEIPPVIQPS